jgi:hypothetical protein
MGAALIPPLLALHQNFVHRFAAPRMDPEKHARGVLGSTLLFLSWRYLPHVLVVILSGMM